MVGIPVLILKTHPIERHAFESHAELPCNTFTLVSWSCKPVGSSSL